jgi:DNA-binding CsgD family transcriptional regulator
MREEGTMAARAELSTGSSGVVSPTMVGRADELAALVAAATAPPSVAVVVGEAGIGKTRLVTELAASEALDGRRLVRGGCRRIREPFPLGPVIDAVRSLRSELAGAALSPVAGALRPLLPEIAHLLPPRPEPLDDRVADRHRVFRGLVEVLAALGPAVLVLEDLHWADELTADFLSYLLADPPTTLSLVLTYRDEDVDPTVRALTTSVPAGVGRHRVDLPPLDDRQTGDLAAAVLGTTEISAEFATYLRERAAGLPYAVEELLALLRARSSLVQARDGWARRNLDQLDVPARIRDSVLERVSRLDPATRAVVRAAAVLAEAVPVAVLIEVADPAADHTAGLDEAVLSGLLTETAETVGFRHPLAAQAVYEELPGATRRVLHERAATALAATTPVPLGQLAHHLRQAGRLTEWAVAAARAADAAVELGHDAEAMRLLREVLTTAPLSAEQRGRMATTLAQVAIETMADRSVLDLVLPMLEEDLPRPVRGELRMRLGLLFNHLGYDSAVAHRVLAEATEDLDHRPDLLAWAMACLGAPLAPGVTLAEHVRWLDRALAVLDRVDDRGFEIFLLGKIASFLAPVGHPRWRTTAERMMARSGGAPRTRQELIAYESLVGEACNIGDYTLLAAAAPAVPACESRRLTLRNELAEVTVDFFTGDWNGLRERADTLVEELASSPRDWFDIVLVSGCLALAAGETDLARQRLETMVADREVFGLTMLPVALGALARLAVARGDAKAAVACADRLLADATDKGIWAPAGNALPSVAAGLVSANLTRDAHRLVDRYADELETLDVPLAPIVVRHARAVLAEAGGERAGAVAGYLASADGYAALPHRYLAAQAREGAARCLFATHDPGAGEHFVAAVSAYRELGARWDIDRMASLGRRNGMALPAWHRGGHRGYGPDLSPREREVAVLAAGGRTNKEIAATLFLSAKTIDKHLSAALRKLGLRSRVALAAQLGTGQSEIGESSP